MSKESYQPSEEEIKRAEDIMTKEEKEISDKKEEKFEEKLIQELSKEKGHGREISKIQIRAFERDGISINAVLYNADNGLSFGWWDKIIRENNEDVQHGGTFDTIKSLSLNLYEGGVFFNEKTPKVGDTYYEIRPSFSRSPDWIPEEKLTEVGKKKHERNKAKIYAIKHGVALFEKFIKKPKDGILYVGSDYKGLKGNVAGSIDGIGFAIQKNREIIFGDRIIPIEIKENLIKRLQKFFGTLFE